MSITEEQVRESLKQVIDPELFVNIVDLGLIYTVTVAPAANPTLGAVATTPAVAVASDLTASSATGTPDVVATTPPAADAPNMTEQPEPAEKEDIFIEMTMTSPACPAGPQLIGNSRQVLQRIPGVSNVEIKIVMTPPWTPDLMSEDAKDQLGIF